MDSFSREFETAYMETLRRRHGTQRMNANNVYQEVIQDKHHVHMNSTKWATLTDFVQYLGKKGLCVVEETERGWYVTYIERDPALLARQEAVRMKTEADKREERLAAERRETLRMEAAKALDRAGCEVERKASEIGDRAEGGVAKMEMKLGAPALGGAGEKKKRKRGAPGGKVSLLEEEDSDDDDGQNDNDEPGTTGGTGGAKSNADSTIGYNDRKRPAAQTAESDKRSKRESDRSSKETERKDSKRHKSSNGDEGDRSEKRKDYWLHRDIVVRIISQKLAGGEYYKRKAVVDRVIDRYEAEVEVLESSRKAGDGGDVLRLDQDDLETVVPKEPGEKVRILNGRHRGSKARVVSLDKREYRAELRLAEGGGIVEVDYEDFSMIA